MKLSIIVPIYNIEQYIDECILSVINQNYKNFELILVDDGSPDRCGEIIDSYATQNHRIKVIHKKNGGLSDARNAGLAKATGDYILFLDGDDTLYNGCLEKINQLLTDNKNVDLLSCNFCVYGKQCENNDLVVNDIYSLNDYIKLINDIPWSAWRNVYKKKIFKDSSLVFEKGLIGAEDCEFFIRFYEKTSKRLFSNLFVVNYRVNRDGSITNKMSYKAINGELKVFSKYFYKFYEKGNREIYSLFANKYLNTISTINSLNNDELNSVIEHINSNMVILKYSHGFKFIIAKFIWKIFGFEKGTKLIRKII